MDVGKLSCRLHHARHEEPGGGFEEPIINGRPFVLVAHVFEVPDVHEGVEQVSDVPADAFLPGERLKNAGCFFGFHVVLLCLDKADGRRYNNYAL